MLLSKLVSSLLIPRRTHITCWTRSWLLYKLL